MCAVIIAVLVALVAWGVRTTASFPGDGQTPGGRLPEDAKALQDWAPPRKVLMHPLAAIAAGLGFNWTAAAFRSLRGGRMLTLMPDGAGFSLSVESGPGAWRIDPVWERSAPSDPTGELRTGDPDFDDVFSLSGDVVAVLNALTPEARALLVRLGPAATLQADDGLLMLAMPLMPERQLFTEAVAVAAAMAEQVGSNERLGARLLARLDEEPTSVRRQVLTAILSEPDTTLGMRRQAGARVLKQDPPELKVLAAEVGMSGRWEWIAELALDEQRPAALRERASRAAQFVGEGHECVALGEALLLAVDPLTLADDSGAASVVAAAASLAQRGSGALPEDVEDTLVQALGFLTEAEKREVLALLKSRGTARSVAPLKVLAARWNTAGAVRRAASEAADAIQSRLVNAEPGAITLSAPDGGAGALSLTDEWDSLGGGAVSLAGTDERD